MRLLIPLALIAALSGCMTTQVDAGKALAVAQDAVTASALGVHQAYVAGVVGKANVRAADKLVDRADEASKAARSVYPLDASTVQATIITLSSLAAEIVALEKPQ